MRPPAPACGLPHTSMFPVLFAYHGSAAEVPHPNFRITYSHGEPHYDDEQMQQTKVGNKSVSRRRSMPSGLLKSHMLMLSHLTVNLGSTKLLAGYALVRFIDSVGRHQQSPPPLLPPSPIFPPEISRMSPLNRSPRSLAAPPRRR